MAATTANMQSSSSLHSISGLPFPYNLNLAAAAPFTVDITGFPASLLYSCSPTSSTLTPKGGEVSSHTADPHQHHQAMLHNRLLGGHPSSTSSTPDTPSSAGSRTPDTAGAQLAPSSPSPRPFDAAIQLHHQHHHRHPCRLSYPSSPTEASLAATSSAPLIKAAASATTPSTAATGLRMSCDVPQPSSCTSELLSVHGQFFRFGGVGGSGSGHCQQNDSSAACRSAFPKPFTIEAILGLENHARSMADAALNIIVSTERAAVADSTSKRKMKSGMPRNRHSNGTSQKRINNGKAECRRDLHHHTQDMMSRNIQLAATPSEKQTKLKRVRTIFTPEQLERLESEFERQQYMVGPERLYLAASLNLTEAQVKVWFQNRRIKWRKQHLEMQQARLAKIRKDEGGNAELLTEITSCPEDNPEESSDDELQ